MCLLNIKAQVPMFFHVPHNHTYLFALFLLQPGLVPALKY